MSIKKELTGIKENISLSQYTTFKIGGLAKYFFLAKSKKDLVEAVLLAGKFNLPFFVLGGGSNLLISNKKYNGLIIKTQFSKLVYDSQECKIIAEAGLPLNKLVSFCLEKELGGLEWANGIPGTIGGAVCGNAGAFGQSIGKAVKKVEVLEIKENKIKTIEKKDCFFNYRNSVFKNNKNLIVLSIEIKLKKDNKKGIRNKMENCLKQKKETQPLNFPSAGSIFKNPKDFSVGRLGDEDRSSFSTFVPSAARLIEECNLKGKRIGGAEVSCKHANFILNYSGKARAEDVNNLINLIKKEVRNKFKINLEEEICRIGF
jgi:UDP-N-acetylmuramate dehydrogenase